MNASSQSPGSMPGPVPLQQVPVALVAPAVVNPDVPVSLVVHRPEPLLPQCFDCGTRTGSLAPCPRGRRYPSGSQVLHCPAHRPATTPVQAAVGVMSAELREGPRSVAELAQAEQDADLLFDPQRAKDIADAAYEQAKAENAAELAQAAQDREALDWFHARWKAVIRLLAGRPADDLMFVHEVLAAADPKALPAAPMSLFWDGLVMGPSGDTEHENTLVPCTTTHGAQAFLVLDDERRLALGALLLATVHTAEGCTTPGCGTSADDTDASNPFLFGWILLNVAGTEGGPRWWCAPACAYAAMNAGGAELADVDQAAAVDPNEPVGYTLTPDAGPVPYAFTEQVHDVIAGASESAAATVLAAAADVDDVDQADEIDARYEYALQVAEATEDGFEDERGHHHAEDGGL